MSRARHRRVPIAWNDYTPSKPEFIGIRQLGPAGEKNVQPISLNDLLPFIDWSPFFHAWEIRGRYPALLDNPKARELFEDGQKLLDQIVTQRRLVPRAVYGFFPANSVGDDVEVYTDESRTTPRTTARSACRSST